MLDSGWIAGLFDRFGLTGVFLATLLEYACLPLPSEVLLPLAGCMAASAGIAPALMVFVTVAAGVAGSAVCYALGAFGGRPLLNRMLKHFPAALSQLEKTEKWHQGTGGLSVMLARVVPLFRTWISFVSGICRQRFSFFLLYSTVGIIVWNTALVLSGYLLFTAGHTLPGFVRFLPAVGWLTLLVFFMVQKKRAAAEKHSARQRA